MSGRNARRRSPVTAAIGVPVGTQPGETPWFDGACQPVQIGVYKRFSAARATVLFSYWDGTHWLWNCRSANLAVCMSSTEPSLVQQQPWCGLTAPPPAGYGPLPTVYERGEATQ